MKALILKSLERLGYKLSRVDEPRGGMSREQFDAQAYAEVPREKLERRPFYNFGAGGFRHPFWTNVDMPSDWYGAMDDGSTIPFDLESLQTLPIQTGTAEAAYSSHTVEHISDEAAENLFREVRRILPAGKVFRITCPDIDLAYHAWCNRDRLFFYWTARYSRSGEMKRTGLRYPMNQASLEQVFLKHFAASASSLHLGPEQNPMTDNDIRQVFESMDYEAALDHCVSRCDPELQKVHPGWHINWWNFDKLGRKLKAAGFTHVVRSGYG